MTRQSASYYRLLGDLSEVPAEYIRDVSHMKRFLERWTMDPKYQAAFASDPEAALTDLGIDLTPAEVISHGPRGGHGGDPPGPAGGPPRFRLPCRATGTSSTRRSSTAAGSGPRPSRAIRGCAPGGSG